MKKWGFWAAVATDHSHVPISSSSFLDNFRLADQLAGILCTCNSLARSGGAIIPARMPDNHDGPQGCRDIND